MDLTDERLKDALLETERMLSDSFAKKAIIGISGGKDSTIAAALCAKVLSPENVIGVWIPLGDQSETEKSAIAAMNAVGIPEKNRLTIDITSSYDALCGQLFNGGQVSYEVKSNLPARLRMSVLYAVASRYDGGRVINTCNFSEMYLGWFTKYGDGAGDVNILSPYLCTDVIKIGEYLGLPSELINRAPTDDMCGKTDEDKFGFTYRELDEYLADRGSQFMMTNLSKMVEKMHDRSLHKFDTNLRWIVNNGAYYHMIHLEPWGEDW